MAIMERTPPRPRVQPQGQSPHQTASPRRTPTRATPTLDLAAGAGRGGMVYPILPKPFVDVQLQSRQEAVVEAQKGSGWDASESTPVQRLSADLRAPMRTSVQASATDEFPSLDAMAAQGREERERLRAVGGYKVSSPSRSQQSPFSSSRTLSSPVRPSSTPSIPSRGLQRHPIRPAAEHEVPASLPRPAPTRSGALYPQLAARAKDPAITALGNARRNSLTDTATAAASAIPFSTPADEREIEPARTRTKSSEEERLEMLMRNEADAFRDTRRRQMRGEVTLAQNGTGGEAMEVEEQASTADDEEDDQAVEAAVGDGSVVIHSEAEAMQEDDTSTPRAPRIAPAAAAPRANGPAAPQARSNIPSALPRLAAAVLKAAPVPRAAAPPAPPLPAPTPSRAVHSTPSRWDPTSRTERETLELRKQNASLTAEVSSLRTRLASSETRATKAAEEAEGWAAEAGAKEVEAERVALEAAACLEKEKSRIRTLEVRVKDERLKSAEYLWRAQTGQHGFDAHRMLRVELVRQEAQTATQRGEAERLGAQLAAEREERVVLSERVVRRDEALRGAQERIRDLKARSARGQDEERRVAELEEELESVREELEGVKAAVRREGKEHAATLKDAKAEATKTANELRKEVKELQKAEKKVEAESAKLRKEVERLREQLAKAQAALESSAPRRKPKVAAELQPDTEDASTSIVINRPGRKRKAGDDDATAARFAPIKSYVEEEEKDERDDRPVGSKSKKSAVAKEATAPKAPKRRTKPRKEEEEETEAEETEDEGEQQEAERDESFEAAVPKKGRSKSGEASRAKSKTAAATAGTKGKGKKRAAEEVFEAEDESEAARQASPDPEATPVIPKRTKALKISKAPKDDGEAAEQAPAASSGGAEPPSEGVQEATKAKKKRRLLGPAAKRDGLIGWSNMGSTLNPALDIPSQLSPIKGLPSSSSGGVGPSSSNGLGLGLGALFGGAARKPRPF